jgi:calcineurin-like phosphoesterase family protein
MNKIYFTSDLHFSHANIIKYEGRPFKNVSEMDKALIKNWNDKVNVDDEVYILGDFAFCNEEKSKDIASKLNGIKYLIKGNHDKNIDYNSFEWVKDYFVLRRNKMKFILFHFPISVFDGQHHGNSIHLYGHVHSNTTTQHPLVQEIKNSYNVGVDVNNFAPIELNEILEKLNYKGCDI